MFHVCRVGTENKAEPWQQECKIHLLLSMFMFNVAMVARNWNHDLEVTQNGQWKQSSSKEMKTYSCETCVDHKSTDPAS